jgi:hypothetical protein
MNGLSVLVAGTCIAAACLSADPAGALDRRVKIINNTSQIMVKFQASNRDSRSWEEDILGQDIIKPGHTVNVNINDGKGYCVFDFRATFRGGQTVVRRGVNVCRVASWTLND